MEYRVGVSRYSTEIENFINRLASEGYTLKHFSFTGDYGYLAVMERERVEGT